jgi:ribonuclease HI
MPRKAIKSQILADFDAEWTDTQLPPLHIQAECWTLYFDGSVMKTRAGADLLFISPLGEHMRYAVRLHFPMSNNMAEYEALLYGLRIAIETGIKCLNIRVDSQLVIDQVMKNTSCHDDKMEAYCNAVRALEDKFYGIELNHISRKYKEEADELTKIASGRITVPPNVFARDVVKPSIDLSATPSNPREPSGAPSSPVGAAPMDEDPRMRRSYSPCSRATGRTRPRPWRRSQPPTRRIGGPNTSPGWIEGNSHQIGPRPGASPEWPNRSLS